MTVGELIAILSKFDMEMDVVYSGESSYAASIAGANLEEWNCIYDGDKSFIPCPTKVVNIDVCDSTKYSYDPEGPANHPSGGAK